MLKQMNPNHLVKEVLARKCFGKLLWIQQNLDTTRINAFSFIQVKQLMEPKKL
jgi:hypothetical protein